MDYQKTAMQIVTSIGDKENIISVMHCATRLRLVLKDYSLVDEEQLNKIDAVKGTFMANNQYQIILGPGVVNLVCDEISKHLGNITKEDELVQEKGNLLQRAVKLLSDIFVPIIPAIVAGGLLMGINNILTANGLFFDDMSVIAAFPQFEGLAAMINVFANAAFTFLPVLIGFSATKKFGGNPYLGAAMGMIMVHPELLNAYELGSGVDIPYWNVLGLNVAAVGYQGTVLPVLAVSWILAGIEKKLHKITPIWLDNLTTPLFSTLITGAITFILVGPMLRSAGDLLAAGITWLYSSLGAIGGAIFGFFYAPICLTGMHHSFIAIETQLLAAVETTGGSFIFTTASMSNVAQGAAVLAVLFITKNEKIKSLCSAAGVSALLGITEPAMFGITLKMHYPFIAAMIGAGLGSAYIAYTHTLAIALGAAGIPGFLSIAPQNWLHFGIGLIIASVTAFILTILFAKLNQKTTLKAICKGKVAPIEETPDELFATKTMGEGVVFFPTENKIYAPANALVSFVFPTKHAIGLTLDNGIELLIHCGIDTVKLGGAAFDVKVKEGDHIQCGDIILVFDEEMIKNAGLSTATPLIITKSTDKKVKFKRVDEVSKNDIIATME